MATISYSRSNFEASRGIMSINWLLMGNADIGQMIECPFWMDKTIHLFGTFGGATVVLQGSNDPRCLLDPTGSTADWQTLRDPGGTALSMTAATLKSVLELPRFIRPQTSGGAGTSLNLYMNARSLLK